MTNDKAIKNLVKALNNEHPLFYAILRERIIKIMEMTMESIETEPERWNNNIIHPDVYKSLDQIVQKHLSFND